jgi:hypothetical protein
MPSRRSARRGREEFTASVSPWSGPRWRRGRPRFAADERGTLSSAGTSRRQSAQQYDSAGPDTGGRELSLLPLFRRRRRRFSNRSPRGNSSRIAFSIALAKRSATWERPLTRDGGHCAEAARTPRLVLQPHDDGSQDTDG